MATYIFAPWGNDNLDGLSWKHANRHIINRDKHNNTTVYATGYFENFQIHYNYYKYTFVGYGKTIINGLNYYTNLEYRGQYYNIDFYNFNRIGNFTYGSEIKYCYFKDIKSFGNQYTPFNYCIFKHVNSLNFRYTLPYSYRNNTIYKCTLSLEYGSIYNSIVADSNIYMSRLSHPENVLFINCKFRFLYGGNGTDETEYTYPVGETDLDKLYDLRYRMVNVYGGNAEDYLINCVYYSGPVTDVLIDPENDIYSLVENSIAEHMSIDGGYIGAKEVGLNITNLNLENINSTSGLLIDDTQDAIIETDIIDLGSITEIKDININSIIEYKNGHQLNYENNLGNIIDPGIDVLQNDMTYVTINDIIETNDTYYTHYKNFETFNATYDENYSTSGTSGSVGNGLGFVTYDDGKVQEVFYEKSFEKYKIVISDNDPTLTNGIELAMLYGEIPTVNLDENGVPIYGNADLNYSNFDKKTLYTRYIKIYITIKVNNLKIRNN